MLGAINFLTTIINMRAPGNSCPREINFSTKLIICWESIQKNLSRIVISRRYPPQRLDIGNRKIFVSSNNENKFNLDQLGSYLAGLIEGDGHIYVPPFPLQGQRKRNAFIRLTFNKNDLPLAEKLLKTIGHGYIQSQLDYGVYRLVIANQEGLIKVVNLINGKFRTPKIEGLHNLIE
jgi:hypothetical protein